MVVEMLGDVRNYLDITWQDDETDRKLTGIIKRGMAYINQAAGAEQDYTAEGMPRTLLFDYCRYARNNASEMFDGNFRAELIALRMGVQADDYAREQGYI